MALVDDLSDAQDLPYDALLQAARTPDRIAAGVLRVVEAAARGADLSDREQNLLFWGLHVLGEVRDTRLFGPLLKLLHRSPDDLEVLLGDAITGTLPRLAVSVFDGDSEALLEILTDPEVDEFVRWSLFGALLFLTFEGRIARERVHAFLVRFERDRLARAGDAAWNGWAEAVALLGFEDLRDRFTAGLDEGRILGDVADPAWFEACLFEALDKPGDPNRFTMHRFGYLGPAVEELDWMLSADDRAEQEPEAPLLNPLRDVGRNDPCPCGSGKKFKKCCLGKEQVSALFSAPPLPPMRGR